MVTKIKVKQNDADSTRLEAEIADIIRLTHRISVDNIMKSWRGGAKRIVREEVFAALGSGRSPVAGEGRFEEYSESYKKQIERKLKQSGIKFRSSAGRAPGVKMSKVKRVGGVPPARATDGAKRKRSAPIIKLRGKRVRPVNLRLSGDTWRTFKVLNKGTGFLVKFTGKLAAIHSIDGVPRKNKPPVVRKMLPVKEQNDEFTPVITRRLRKALRDAAKKLGFKLTRRRL